MLYMLAVPWNYFLTLLFFNWRLVFPLLFPFRSRMISSGFQKNVNASFSYYTHKKHYKKRKKIKNIKSYKKVMYGC